MSIMYHDLVAIIWLALAMPIILLAVHFLLVVIFEVIEFVILKKKDSGE